MTPTFISDALVNQVIHKIVRQKLIMAAACILWLLCLITLSVIPYTLTEKLPETDTAFRWDYLEHFAGYFLLAILAGLWRSDRNFSLSRSAIIMIIAAGLALSFVLEYIQLFIPGRAYNLIDFAFNVAGLFAGFLIVYFLILHVLRRSAHQE